MQSRCWVFARLLHTCLSLLDGRRAAAVVQRQDEDRCEGDEVLAAAREAVTTILIGRHRPPRPCQFAAGKVHRAPTPCPSALAPSPPSSVSVNYTVCRPHHAAVTALAPACLPAVLYPTGPGLCGLWRVSGIQRNLLQRMTVMMPCHAQIPNPPSVAASWEPPNG